MVKRKRKNIFLITSIIALLGLFFCIFFFSPTTPISLTILQIPLYMLSFVLIFVTLYSLTAYITRSFIHGILIGLFPIVYVTLRLNELTSPLFFVLLAGIFVGLEILLVQMTNKHTP